MFSIQPYDIFKNISFFETSFISFVGYLYVCLGYLCITAEIEISHSNSGENSFSLCLSPLRRPISRNWIAFVILRVLLFYQQAKVKTG